jgi:hypothetical protein
MATECTCHTDLAFLVGAGFDFHDANRKVGKSGYHEHRCECGCGCNSDTLGYAKCPTCSFDRDCAYSRRTIQPSARAKRIAARRK